VAIGLIGLRWHYFTDIVAGAAVGIGTVCGLALVLDLPALRRWFGRERDRRGRDRPGRNSTGRNSTGRNMAASDLPRTGSAA
jgi:hypothetical protein